MVWAGLCLPRLHRRCAGPRLARSFVPPCRSETMCSAVISDLLLNPIPQMQHGILCVHELSIMIRRLRLYSD